jgi:hypothetical protein
VREITRVEAQPALMFVNEAEHLFFEAGSGAAPNLPFISPIGELERGGIVKLDLLGLAA